MNMRYKCVSLIALASVAACAASPPPSEDVGSTEQAATSGGLTAAVAITSKNSQQYWATVTVTNGSSEPAYNWQVGVNLNQSILQQGIIGAEVDTIAGATIFTPTPNGRMLSPGAATTFSFTANIQGSNYAPTIATMDGVANGAPGAGQPADGVDRIARAVATGALNVAEAYENNKLANKGDANYANYDGLIWSAQSYVIAGNKIAFDPNVPGYSYIPVQAMAQLDAMQDNPSVASYLVTGLASCFAETSGMSVYNFKAGVLKGFVYPGPLSGTLPGGTPPPGSWAPPGYNPATATDAFTASGAAVNGAEQITITMTSAADYWFGLLTASSMNSFSNVGSVLAKFKSGNQTSCSPFNGPGGGTANPLLVVTVNGSSVQARFQGAGAQCQNGCKSTMVVDPDAYATVGPYVDTLGLVGPQPNPFTYDSSETSATPDHFLQWASSTDVYGNIVFGLFLLPVNHRGIITGYTWMQQ